MPDSTNLLSQIYVKIDGADPPEGFMRDLLEVTVENSLHLPDVATLVLHDARLHCHDEDSLSPGKTIQDTHRVERQQKRLLDGEIVEIELDFEATKRVVRVLALP